METRFEIDKSQRAASYTFSGKHAEHKYNLQPPKTSDNGGFQTSTFTFWFTNGSNINLLHAGLTTLTQPEPQVPH